MIQAFGQSRARTAPRRASAVLLAILLNMALIPCSMAIEVVEEGHDCCPPEIKLEALECCELDDANVDSRSGKHDLTPDLEPVAAGVPHNVAALAPTPVHANSDPPDPPDPSVALHKRHCVYLK